MNNEKPGYNNFFEIKDKRILPKGAIIVNNSGLWLIKEDYQSIFYYTTATEQPIEYRINELELKPANDVIYTIDFIESNRLYIYARKSHVPTGFLVDVNDSTNYMSNYSEIQIENKTISVTTFLSFALDTFFFHRQILVSYTPLRGSFVIISKEGITLHDLNLKSYFTLIQPITFFLYSKNYLYVSHELDTYIYRFDLLLIPNETRNSDENLHLDEQPTDSSTIQLHDSANHFEVKFPCFYSTTQIWESHSTNGSYPCAFISLSYSLLIITNCPEKKSFTVQIIWFDQSKESKTYDMDNDIHQNLLHSNSKQRSADLYDSFMCLDKFNESEWYVPYFSFISYDDCIIFVDKLNDGLSSFIDFAEESQYTCIVKNFQLPSKLKFENIFCRDVALCSCDNQRMICTISPKYSEIASDSLYVIASLMRRNEGLNASIDKIRNLLSYATTTDLYQIVDIIGPAAIEPSSQVRFARLIQFSGIQNPHLIALVLLKFIKIIGNKLINETMIPVIESLSHPILKPLIDSIISNGMLPLDERTMYCLITEFEKMVHINESNVEDMLQYANALIDLKMWKSAKIAIIKAKLSNQYTPEQITEIESRLNENC